MNVYTLEQSEEWDLIVKSFEKYDVYYLSGYVKAFQIHGDGKPLLFFYEDENARGINVVMKRDIADIPQLRDEIEQNTFFDFSTPYGYGGWLIEGKDADALFRDYESWCRGHHIISEFVRFHPMLENQKPSDLMYEVIPLGETVAMDLSSPDAVWNNLTSKNRNMIRKARKNNVKIYNGRYPEIFEKFRGVYNATMDKDDAEKYYYFKPEFYNSILDDLPQNAQVFYAQVPDGTIAAGSIMIGANGYLNYHLSGFVQEYGKLAATNLLLYEAALWGCENGYKSFYLGGGVGSSEDGLFKFKRGFYRSGPLRRFYVGRKVFDREMYERLVSLRQQDDAGFNMDTGYFPKYRG